MGAEPAARYWSRKAATPSEEGADAAGVVPAEAPSTLAASSLYNVKSTPIIGSAPVGTLPASAVEPLPGSDDAEGVLYLWTVIDAVPSSVRSPWFSACAEAVGASSDTASASIAAAIAIRADSPDSLCSICFPFVPGIGTGRTLRALRRAAMPQEAPCGRLR